MNDPELKHHDSQTLALIVRQPPYAQRSARAQLDGALAAAALELPLELYFLGEGIWQLAAGRETESALLPRGLKGWAALEEMTKVRYFAEPTACRRLRELDAQTAVPVEVLEPGDMARRWRSCGKVMAL